MKPFKYILTAAFIVGLFFFCTKVEMFPIEEIKCGYCWYEERQLQDSFCGSYDQVQDWFYEFSLKNEFDHEHWICILKK